MTGILVAALSYLCVSVVVALAVGRAIRNADRTCPCGGHE